MSICNVLVEQFLLGACVHYHRVRVDSPFKGVAHHYVFPDEASAFHPAQAQAIGYTHLLSSAKRNPEVTSRLLKRIQLEHADFLELCLDAAEVLRSSRKSLKGKGTLY